jgi:hypothetical protein
MLEEAGMLDEGGTVELTGFELDAAAELVLDELTGFEELTDTEEDGAASDELAAFELLAVLDELPMLDELPTTEDDGTASSTPASCAKVLNGIDTFWPVTLSSNLIVLSQQSSLQQSLSSGRSKAIVGGTASLLPLRLTILAAPVSKNTFMCRANYQLLNIALAGIRERSFTLNLILIYCTVNR